MNEGGELDPSNLTTLFFCTIHSMEVVVKCMMNGQRHFQKCHALNAVLTMMEQAIDEAAKWGS